MKNTILKGTKQFEDLLNIEGWKNQKNELTSGDLIRSKKSANKIVDYGYCYQILMTSGYWFTLEKTEELKIGQKVEWTIGNVKSEGAVLESKGEITEVMTHYIGGVRSNREVEVLTELLIKVN